MITTEEKERILGSLERIERGLYGDKDNRQQGLIDRVERIEGWITKSKMKIAYLSGAVATVVVGLRVAWEWVVEHFRGGIL